VSNFGEALADAARSGVCQLLGIPEYINDALERIGFFPFDEARRAIPNFWRNLLCDTDAPPPNSPPFTGGQCECAGYRVTFQRTIAATNDRQVITTQPFPGPITGLFESQESGATFLRLEHGLCSGQQYFGQTRTLVSSTGALSSFGILSVQRTSGQDNCGNPPVVYPPLTPPDVTIPRDVTYENSLGVTVVVPVVFVYARANIDARANITIPFTATVNAGVTFNGTVNLDGSVTINVGSSVPSGRPKDPRKSPCDDIAIPVEDPSPDPTDSDQPDNPDRDKEEVIIGVLVTVTSLSNERASLIVQEDNPDIYAPNLGFVQFLCRIGQTSGGWTTDIPVKNRRHLIQCPWDQGAIAVRGTPQPGVEWTLTPVAGYAGIPVQYVS
jgi:hypothetical protein